MAQGSNDLSTLPLRKMDRKTESDRGKMSFVSVCVCVCVCVVVVVVDRKKEDERERDSSSEGGKTLLRFFSHKRPWTQGSPRHTAETHPSELWTTTANRFTKQQTYTQHHG